MLTQKLYELTIETATILDLIKKNPIGRHQQKHNVILHLPEVLE